MSLHPAVLDAGATAAWAEIGTFKMWPGFDMAEFLERIYVAMQSVQPAPTVATAKRVLTLRLETGDLERELHAFTDAVAELKAFLEAAEEEPAAEV